MVKDKIRGIGMELIKEEKSKKRGRRPKNEKREYIVNRSQTKFFVDLGDNKKQLELIFNLLVVTGKVKPKSVGNTRAGNERWKNKFFFNKAFIHNTLGSSRLDSHFQTRVFQGAKYNRCWICRLRFLLKWRNKPKKIIEY